MAFKQNHTSILSLGTYFVKRKILRVFLKRFKLGISDCDETQKNTQQKVEKSNNDY